MTSPQQSQPALTTRSRPESSKVLLIESDRKQLKLLSQTLRSLVGRVDCFSELSGLADMGSIGDYDLIIADYDGLAPEGRQVLVNAVSASIARPRLLLFSEGKNKDDLVTLFDERSLTNLVARNADVEIDDLIVTVQKIMRKDIFGIEKYFCWGVEALTLEVSSSADKPAVLAEAEKFAGLIGIHPRMTNLLCTVADEFVTNAIYNAPMNKGGQPRYSHRPRTETVVLEPRSGCRSSSAPTAAGWGSRRATRSARSAQRRCRTTWPSACARARTRSTRRRGEPGSGSTTCSSRSPTSWSTSRPGGAPR